MQDIVLTMFRAHTRTHGRTDERTRQNHYASGHAMLGGGIKINKVTQYIIGCVSCTADLPLRAIAMVVTSPTRYPYGSNSGASTAPTHETDSRNFKTQTFNGAYA